MYCQNCFKNQPIEKVYDKELNKVKYKCKECGSVLDVRNKPKNENIGDKISKFLKENKKYKVVYGKSQENVLAGNAFIIDAKSEEEAKKNGRKMLKDRWWLTGNKILYAIEYKKE